MGITQGVLIGHDFSFVLMAVHFPFSSYCAPALDTLKNMVATKSIQ